MKNQTDLLTMYRKVAQHDGIGLYYSRECLNPYHFTGILYLPERGFTLTISTDVQGIKEYWKMIDFVMTEKGTKKEFDNMFKHAQEQLLRGRY